MSPSGPAAGAIMSGCRGGVIDIVFGPALASSLRCKFAHLVFRLATHTQKTDRPCIHVFICRYKDVFNNSCSNQLSKKRGSFFSVLFCLFFCLNVSLHTLLPPGLTAHLPVCLPIHTSFCLSSCPSICQSSSIQSCVVSVS